MKKIKKLILGILIIILITIICALIAIKVGNKNMIQKQLEETQKLTETSEENSYITTEDHLAEVNASVLKLTEFKSAIANYIGEAGGVKPEATADTITFGNSIKNIVTEVTKDATATASDIAEGKTAWVNGQKITGSIPFSGGNYYYRAFKGSDSVANRKDTLKVNTGVFFAYYNYSEIANTETGYCFCVKDGKVIVNRSVGTDDFSFSYSNGILSLYNVATSRSYKCYGFYN